jgi:hypothetical protein
VADAKDRINMPSAAQDLRQAAAFSPQNPSSSTSPGASPLRSGDGDEGGGGGGGGGGTGGDRDDGRTQEAQAQKEKAVQAARENKLEKRARLRNKLAALDSQSSVDASKETYYSVKRDLPDKLAALNSQSSLDASDAEIPPFIRSTEGGELAGLAAVTVTKETCYSVKRDLPDNAREKEAHRASEVCNLSGRSLLTL